MRTPPENLPSVSRRLRAGQLLLDGLSVKEVAEQLHMTPATVKRYQALVSEGGLEALRQMQVGGKVSALSPEALQWIVVALNGSAMDYGFDSESWTNARLRQLIEREFGVRFSRVYVWQLTNDLGVGHRLMRS
ncbi:MULTISPECIES: helix-turn-helix domain-containing protein [unclassified Caballeronia]|uniref:helix-turn-helix domain-containing protein n=1 Tax=unclassified Caballeronia TaxID=2646786 RepID=UPI00285672DD|nr:MULTISPECIES: helix-turn-helix domain-containing protein [unclassified Caballeronia]MDR5740196.1 helix-turn-helix domain-containing protein [Caballeronia sp. LZ016]MDR5809272.1 helix-turn-helix domain-containing protein [Caballeronia sp. LZ019]